MPAPKRADGRVHLLLNEWNSKVEKYKWVSGVTRRVYVARSVQVFVEIYLKRIRSWKYNTALPIALAICHCTLDSPFIQPQPLERCRYTFIDVLTFRVGSQFDNVIESIERCTAAFLLPSCCQTNSRKSVTHCTTRGIVSRLRINVILRMLD